MQLQAPLDSTNQVDSCYSRRRSLSANRLQNLSCRPRWRHLWSLRDLIRSLPVRSASGLPVYVAASPGRSILDYAEFTLSERSESNGLRSQ
jgi:hypothetical protein